MFTGERGPGLEQAKKSRPRAAFLIRHHARYAEASIAALKVALGRMIGPTLDGMDR